MVYLISLALSQFFKYWIILNLLLGTNKSLEAWKHDDLIMIRITTKVQNTTRHTYEFAAIVVSFETT